jgi:ribosomal protein L6P/L9E
MRDMKNESNYLKITARPAKVTVKKDSVTIEKKYTVEGNDKDQVGSVSAKLARDIYDWR